MATNINYELFIKKRKRSVKSHKKTKRLNNKVIQSIDNSCYSSIDSKNKEHNYHSKPNTYYLIGSMNKDNINKLHQELRESDRKYKKFCQTYNEIIEVVKPKPFHLHINSPGGEVVPTLALLDTIINNIKIPVHTHIEGNASSCAALVAICGKHRTITKHSTMLIHQLSGMLYGTFQHMEDMMENKTKMMESIKDIIKKYTKLSTERMEELLNRDLDLTADECLKYGFVDEIIV
jgi:ATP-dependent Clp endopeptidase proteolytic subunit ClpP